MRLTLEEKMEIWKLASVKRIALMKKSKRETPKKKRLLGIMVKMGK